MAYRMLALVAATVAVVAGPASAAAPRVTAVDPTAAVAGAAVDVKGRGLKGPGTRVTVAGRRARVLSSSARRLRIVVPPAGAGVRRLVVRRGRRSGSARLRVLKPFTGEITAVPDAARAARGGIGPAGGVVEARGRDGTRYTLRVPAGALAAEEAITVTPITRFRGLPLTGGNAVGAGLEPDGLTFAVPAVLEIAARRAFPRTTLGFSQSGGEDGFVVQRPKGSQTTLQIRIDHFSTAGVSDTQAADFANAVQPIIAATGTLSPNQIESLLSILGAWEDLFPPAFCATQPVCGQAVGKALESLATRIAQSCQSGPRTLATVRELIRFEALRQRLAADDDSSTACRAAILEGMFTAALQAATGDPLGRRSSTIGITPEDGGAGDLDGDRELTHLEFLLFLVGPLQTEGLDARALQALDAAQTLLDGLPASGRARCETDRAGGERDLVRALGYAQTLQIVLQPFIDALDACRIVVVVEPGSATLEAGATQQFGAIVTGIVDTANNGDVTWSATGGAIDAAGFYTAPTTGGTFTIRATSVLNPARSATATVSVPAPEALDADDFTVEIVEGTCDPVFTPACYHPAGDVTFTLSISSTAPVAAEITADVTTVYSVGVPTNCTTYQSSPFVIGAGQTLSHEATVTCTMHPTGGTGGFRNVTARACLTGGGCGPEDTEGFFVCRPGSDGC